MFRVRATPPAIKQGLSLCNRVLPRVLERECFHFLDLGSLAALYLVSHGARTAIVDHLKQLKMLRRCDWHALGSSAKPLTENLHRFGLLLAARFCNSLREISAHARSRSDRLPSDSFVREAARWTLRVLAQNRLSLRVVELDCWTEKGLAELARCSQLESLLVPRVFNVRKSSGWVSRHCPSTDVIKLVTGKALPNLRHVDLRGLASEPSDSNRALVSLLTQGLDLTALGVRRLFNRNIKLFERFPVRQLERLTLSLDHAASLVDLQKLRKGLEGMPSLAHVDISFRVAAGHADLVCELPALRSLSCPLVDMPRFHAPLLEKLSLRILRNDRPHLDLAIDAFRECKELRELELFEHKAHSRTDETIVAALRLAFASVSWPRLEVLHLDLRAALSADFLRAVSVGSPRLRSVTLHLLPDSAGLASALASLPYLEELDVACTARESRRTVGPRSKPERETKHQGSSHSAHTPVVTFRNVHTLSLSESAMAMFDTATFPECQRFCITADLSRPGPVLVFRRPRTFMLNEVLRLAPAITDLTLHIKSFSTFSMRDARFDNVTTLACENLMDDEHLRCLIDALPCFPALTNLRLSLNDTLSFQPLASFCETGLLPALQRIDISLRPPIHELTHTFDLGSNLARLLSPRKISIDMDPSMRDFLRSFIEWLGDAACVYEVERADGRPCAVLWRIGDSLMRVPAKLPIDSGRNEASLQAPYIEYEVVLAMALSISLVQDESDDTDRRPAAFSDAEEQLLSVPSA